jgi:queuine tRNA-ribosyltransferase
VVLLALFNVQAVDGPARAGCLHLPGGLQVDTPVFMPVGTRATVKTLDSCDLENLGAQVLLANAYHLYLRPGAGTVSALGGLHRFMSWNRGIITDSGGYQVFSLSQLRKIRPEGVEFTSHLDGSRHLFTPESNMELQAALGSDIAMALDVCASYPSTPGEIRDSVELTTAWARRCKEKHLNLGTRQLLFGIIQGGVIPEARAQSAHELLALDFPGYAVGGLSVGEGPLLMNEVLAYLVPLLPEDKPRYLMGVGTPQDLWDAAGRGIDMFDCAMPTRIARNGTLYTSRGRLVIRNAKYSRDESAPDPDCACPLCAHYSRAYLRHLFNTEEIAGLRLSTLHNLTFMLKLTGLIRKAIISKDFEAAKRDFFSRYQLEIL